MYKKASITLTSSPELITINQLTHPLIQSLTYSTIQLSQSPWSNHPQPTIKMKFTIASIALFLTAVSAMPAAEGESILAARQCGTVNGPCDANNCNGCE